MYERACPQRLDERMTLFFGLEWEEILASFIAGGVVGIVSIVVVGILGIVLGILAGVVILSFLQFIHGGKPGYLFVRLYRAGVWSIVPAAFRPKYLIPILPGPRGARIRLSPVSGEENEGGKRLARSYFNR